MRKKFDEKVLELKYDAGLCREIDCTEEENQKFLEMLKRKEELPFDIARRDENGTKSDRFYRVVPLNITAEEIQEYCALRNTKNIQTIKKCVVFFTTLAVISLLIALFLLLSQS